MSTLSRASQAKLHDIAERYVAGAKNREVPGLVYVAFREGGQPIFEHYAVRRGIEPGTPPMDADTIFWLASFTKLVTSVACMQLVEHGVLELDNPDQIATLAPELRDIKVLERAEDGTFYLVEKRGEISLRMLLNHTAGFGYAFEDEKLAHYGQPVGLDDFCGELSDLLRRPLVNHPGETFQYGTSMDWVGILIERVTGFTLEEVFQKYIFSPLGMVGVTFYPTDETRARLAYLHRRGPDGNLAQRDHLYAKPLRVKEGSQRDEIFCAGGHGLFGPPAEFRKLIGMLLNDGLDLASGARLLNKATVDEMFKDQIPSMPRYSNESVPVAKPHLANPTPLVPMPADHTEGWGLGFSISHLPSETGRPAGVGSWEGLANLFWFADRENKVGAIIASQILPYGANSIPAMSDANTEQRSARFQDLVDLLLSVPKSNFDPFHVHRTSYRSAGRDIGTDVLVPKRPFTGTSRPVMVRIHGGFLVTGSSLFPAWFSKWILDYAELHSAVIISPDYRLLPEVKGTDILDDMAAFWTWFHKGGPSGILQQSGYREKLDPSKLLLLGESAGGYLAVQSVLSGFVEPNAMVLLYPMLDMKADHYTKEYTKPIVNVPNFPSNLVVDFLATLPPTDDKRHEQAITEADPPARLDLALASVQTGRYLDFIGTEPRLFVLDRIESGDYARRKSGKGAVLPPVFLLHGNEDSAVPIQGSHSFLEVLKKADRNAPVHTAFRAGDHGFDFQATLDDEWLLAGLKWAEEEWLVERSKM